ncbi:MAG: calcium-binding protein, partial [Chlorobiaceae bacterium]|nr:calcium-binding protein [Chlorobiaceae bacterium]
IDSAEGAVVDGGNTDVDIVANSGTVVINAVTGVGSANALETTIKTLDVDNSTSGDITIVESDGVTVNNIAEAAAGNISLTSTTGTLTVAADQSGVTTAGEGSITLFADGGNAGVLAVNAMVKSITGNITLQADSNVNFGVGGDVTTTSGNVVVTADYDNGGTGSGALTMSDGTVINAGSGTIDLNSDGNVRLGSVQTTSSSATAVTIDSSEGAILDAAADDSVDMDVDIVADRGTVVMNAVTGIGKGNALETTIGTLDIDNSASGDIEIAETNGVVINKIAQALSGNISLTSTTGTVTVAAGQGGVTALHGTGSITLLADGGDTGNLVVDAVVTTYRGGTGQSGITLLADNDVSFGSAGHVTTTTGNVVVTADYDNGGVSSGELTMSDGAVINAGSGTAALHADGSITLGSVQTTNATATAVTVVSSEGAVVDGSDTHAAIVADSGTAVIEAAAGVGRSGNALDTTVGALEVSNGTSGDILITETNGVTIAKLDQAAVSGEVSLHADGTVNLAADIVLNEQVSLDSGTGLVADPYLDISRTDGVSVNVSGSGETAASDVSGKISLYAESDQYLVPVADFVKQLSDGTVVDVRALTLLSTDAASSGKLTITGDETAKEALVVDASHLDAGSSHVFDLNDVDFAIIVGEATVRGGHGDNYVIGDDANQNIVLGVGDDTLNGAGGNDYIGSLEGDDLLYGGTGNDTVSGGAGNDTLYGDAGNDLLIGGEGTDKAVFTGNYADYRIYLDAANSQYIVTDLRDGSPDGTDTIKETEFAQFADQTIGLAYGVVSASSGGGGGIEYALIGAGLVGIVVFAL